MTDLFGDVAVHDAGGKVRRTLPAGVVGDALFHGENACRRLWLARWVAGADAAPYALFVGMNPSVAGSVWDDPTVGWEWSYTHRRLGLSRYIKTNMLDYCLTESKSLVSVRAPYRSDQNLPTIRGLAAGADIVVVASGCLHPSLRHYADETFAALRADGISLHCFGRNKDGSPKHPLYLRHDTPLIPYEGTQ